MTATPTLFSLLVHHGPTTSIIHDVDPNWYSYMDMCQDVLEIVLVDLLYEYVSRCIRDCTCGLACKHRCRHQHQV